MFSVVCGVRSSVEEVASDDVLQYIYTPDFFLKSVTKHLLGYSRRFLGWLKKIMEIKSEEPRESPRENSDPLLGIFEFSISIFSYCYNYYGYKTRKFDSAALFFKMR